MKNLEIKERFKDAGLVQDDLFAYGMTRPSVGWAVMFGAIGGAISASKQKTYGFTLADGEILQTQIKGKEVLKDTTIKYKKGEVKDIRFKGSILSITPLLGKKVSFQIFKPREDMKTIVDKFLV